jgi:hypothetical protein
VGIEQLNGFQLEAVHFGTAFYNLVFDGEKDGKATTLHVGTNYYISKSVDHLEDLSENISVLLWGFLGKTIEVTKIVEKENFRAIEFIFSNRKSFIVWQESDAIDNLVIVTNPNSKEWFVEL